MKKQVFLCLILAAVLCLTGCVTLQFEPGNTVVSPDGSYQQPAQQPQAGNAPVVQTPTQAPVGSANAAAWSAAEIVSFLNNAVNNAKNSVAGFVMKEKVNHAVSINSINSEPLRAMAESVLENLNYSSETQYTASGGVATAGTATVPVRDLLAPPGDYFAITEQEISAARASFDGENVIIVMTLQDDTAAQQFVPTLHGAKIPFLHLHGKSIEPYAIQSATIAYTGITLAAAVNGQGQLVTMTVSAKAAGQASIGIGVMTAEVVFNATLKESREFVYS